MLKVDQVNLAENNAASCNVGVVPSKRKTLLSAPEAKDTELRSWYLYDASLSAFFFNTAAIIFPILITLQAQYYSHATYCAETGANVASCLETGGQYQGSCDIPAGSTSAFTCHAMHGTWKVLGYCDDDGNSETNYKDCVSSSHRWIGNLHPDASVTTFFGFRYTFFGAIAPLCYAIASILTLLALRTKLEHKSTLIGCTILMISMCSAAFMMDDLQSYQLQSLFYIIAVTAASIASMSYNSFLPSLCQSYGDTRDLMIKGVSDDTVTNSINTLSHTKSLKGHLVGLSGTLIFQIVVTAGVLQVDEQGLKFTNLRLAIVCAAAWIASTSVFCLVTLKNRETESAAKIPNFEIFCELGQVKKYLIGQNFTLGAVQTLYSTLAAYVVINTGLEVESVCIGMVIVSLSSWISIVCWSQVHQLGVSVKKIRLMNLLAMAFLPSSLVLSNSVSPFEFYLSMLVFGSGYGAESTLSRSMFADYIPASHEEEFFTMLDFCSKSTAWVGPLLVGIIYSVIGTVDGMRYGFCVVLLLLLLGAFSLAIFDQEKARQERMEYERKGNHDVTEAIVAVKFKHRPGLAKAGAFF